MPPPEFTPPQTLAARHLAAQRDIAKAIESATSFQEVVPVLLDTLGRHLGWTLGAFWVVDDRDELSCMEIWHDPELDPESHLRFERLSWNLHFERGEGIPGSIWQKGAAIYEPDFPGCNRFPRSGVAGEEGLKVACGVPLRNTLVRGGGVCAVVEFYGNELPTSVDPVELLSLMQVACLPVALLMERLTLERDLQHDHAEKIREEVIEKLYLARTAIDEQQNADASRLLGEAITSAQRVARDAEDVDPGG